MILSVGVPTFILMEKSGFYKTNLLCRTYWFFNIECVIKIVLNSN
ncbi:hypothetical protein LEP1GSC186_3645 [Leptospira noguchii serovar Autumnalis str. ZUN142]|uniref:Uncharacterized protein n=1 Tax=Leptospira noguchii serovar Autumnalis str. ZUN142 TaxID=1085540 RepID=M6UP71_9LEPT|nr:hypothetical protein LEP1GSC186_3645 [Leptospira noguchii serovar Autumnalis str. ZUN142]